MLLINLNDEADQSVNDATVTSRNYKNSGQVKTLKASPNCSGFLVFGQIAISYPECSFANYRHPSSN